jgi:MFS family permease
MTLSKAPVSSPGPDHIGSRFLGWWRAAESGARRALVAASLGWMLDIFDVQLYALVLSSMILDLGMTKATAGSLGSLTLAASAFGGLFFGFIADRYGRTKAMAASILIYSIFTGACGLARSIVELAIFRLLLGLGMGGEWASGAALVSETWISADRGKALAFMQSTSAFGNAAAALVTALVLPSLGWRAVFFVGVLPAFLTLWILRKVEEPSIWLKSRAAAPTSRFRDIFQGRLLPLTMALAIMNGFTLFGFWGMQIWIPAYLSLPTREGGVGLSTFAMSALVLSQQIGQWFGYVTFGFVSDTLGRKRVYILYLIFAAGFVLMYASTRNTFMLLLLGPFVAFFGSGHFAGFGAVTAEIYPTGIRAAGQGFTYNAGRVASAISPYMVGRLAQTRGFHVALSTSALAFLMAAVMWSWIPETKGQELA